MENNYSSNAIKRHTVSTVSDIGPVRTSAHADNPQTSKLQKIINYAQKGYGLSGVATLIGTADIAVGIFLSRDTSFIQSCFHSGLALLSTPISMACGIYASTELEK